MQKLDHQGILKTLDPVERLERTREDSRIRVERPSYTRTAWEDFRLPNLWTEGQVDSGGKYCPAITNRHHAVKSRLL